MKRFSSSVYSLIFLLLCAPILFGQDGKEVFTLELEPYFSEPGNPESESGKISYRRIVQEDRDTAYFRVNGVEAGASVFVQLSLEDVKQELEFDFFYPDTEQAFIGGEINRKNHSDYSFAAEGDFVIRAIPDRVPAAYYILVWVGDETQMDPSRTYELDTTGLGQFETVPIDSEVNVVWVIVFTAFLALILAFLFFKGKRKKEK